MSKVVQHIWEEIRIENTEALEPVFDSGRPIRSTGDMRPWYTGRPCEVTRRSHISHCVYDSTWEASDAFEPHHGLNTLSRPLSITPKPGMMYELFCSIETPVIGIHWLCGKRIDEPLGPVRVRLGTTRGTNALLERKGAPTAFVTTSGFGDLLTLRDRKTADLPPDKSLSSGSHRGLHVGLYPIAVAGPDFTENGLADIATPNRDAFTIIQAGCR